jgi:tetratricopeptide (TPR) repeat protein
VRAPSVLLLLLVLGAPALRAETAASVPALARARALLRAGDPLGAEVAAGQAVAEHPSSGSAHLVLGVARFRAGKYAEALLAFADARGAAEPPAGGPLSFNEGSTLFALGRLTDAENAFNRAAEADPALRAVSFVNAGQAALGRGDVARARLYASRAASEARAERAPGLDELASAIARREAESSAASPLLSPAPTQTPAQLPPVPQTAGAPAAATELRAAAPTARDSDAATAEARDGSADRLALAVASYRARDLGEAERGFLDVLAGAPDPETAAAAEEYLDALSFGLRAGGGGLTLRLAAGGGYDDNAAQASALRTETILAEDPRDPGGAFGTLGLELGHGWLLGRHSLLDVSYALDQLTFASEAFDPFDMQVHAVALRAEWGLSRRLRLQTDAGFDLQLVGLARPTAFTWSASLGEAIAYDFNPYTSSALRLRVSHKGALDKDAKPFAGRRVELRAEQRVRWWRLRGSLALRHRRDDVGSRHLLLSELPDGGTVTTLRGRSVNYSTDERYDAPYSNRSNGLKVGASLRLGPVVLAADASLDRQAYTNDNVRYAIDTTDTRIQRSVVREIARVRRLDTRLTVSPSISADLFEGYQVTLRWDYVRNDSNVTFEFDDKRFEKQVLSLELAVDI